VNTPLPHIMVDIETLSTSTNAAVIAVGLMEFSADEIGRNQLILIDPKLSPGHRSVDTWNWWKTQSGAVFHRMMGGTDTPWFAARLIDDFFRSRPGAKVWANSPAFDLVILRGWMRASGTPLPVSYKNERDCRTVFAMGEDLGHNLNPAWEGLMAHDALDDCRGQVRALQMLVGYGVVTL
jgi:hypothetical protein